MARSTITLGRLVLREDDVVVEAGDSSGGRSMTLTGQESRPRLSAIGVQKRREDFLSMAGKFLPISFGLKSYLNGFYRIDSLSGSIEDWGDGLVVFPWTANITRVGTVSEVDIESRLSGAISRQNNFLVTGERTHAPAIGHTAYWTDATVTQAVTRATTDGNIKVYRGVGANISPRWAIDPLDYGKGRVRFIDDTLTERSGSSMNCNPASWELNNGLVRIRPIPSGGAFEFAAWSGSAWEVKNWDTRAGGLSLAPFDFCSVLYNEFESATIRLTKAQTFGRVYVDITLRRGSRIADLYIQSEFGVTLKVVRPTAEAGTNALSGTVVATSNDADGNKYIIGSAKTFTADIVNGGVEKASTATLDAFVGVVLGGTSAVAGDLAADLQKQYVGAPSELVQGVQR